jgi:hypothetical protein
MMSGFCTILLYLLLKAIVAYRSDKAHGSQ